MNCNDIMNVNMTNLYNSIINLLCVNPVSGRWEKEMKSVIVCAETRKIASLP